MDCSDSRPAGLDSLMVEPDSSSPPFYTIVGFTGLKNPVKLLFAGQSKENKYCTIDGVRSNGYGWTVCGVLLISHASIFKTDT